MTERELNEMIERYEGSREIGIDFPSRGAKRGQTQRFDIAQGPQKGAIS